MTTQQRAFIDKVAPLAQADWPLHRVLPSLTLAQAIKESAWGTSELAVNANALFGIKAAGWDGAVYEKETKEFVDGQYITLKRPFRKYPSWAESIADHGAFLQKDRYAAVIGETDYTKACYAIKAAGYATAPNYAPELVQVIEQFGLDQYDDITKNTEERKTMKICLDPGHGGYQNLGLRGYYESVGNLSACLLLKDELEKYGFEVFMTRTSINENPSIQTARGQMAVKNGCKVFISWHSDANANNATRGVTVIRSLKRPKSVELGKKLATAIVGAMGTKYSPYGGNDGGVWTRPYSAQSPNSDYYAVLRNAVTSDVVEHAFLIEHGFHTNGLDVAVLDSAAGRAKIVQAEAAALAAYFGMSKGDGGGSEFEPEPPAPEDKPAGDALHRVQVGAFKVKANADAFAAKVRAAGFQTITKQTGGLYRVQLGAFAKKENAEAYVATVKAAGFDAFVVEG